MRRMTISASTTRTYDVMIVPRNCEHRMYFTREELDARSLQSGWRPMWCDDCASKKLKDKRW